MSVNAESSKTTVRERLYLFDTTLRDGAQTNGIDFSLEDKIAIADMLDKLGIDYVEGGYPGANPMDTAFFGKKRTKAAAFTAFGMTKRAGRSVENDPGLQGLLQAQSDAICFVAKSWDFHVKVALATTNEENLEGIRQSVAAAVAAGKEALVDCEHFFDGYKANRDYAVACAKAAYEAGARWVVLCDTNGGTLPDEIEAIVTDVMRAVPGDHLGIHAHNDTEQAVSNSLAAVKAGVRQIQGTLNGIGERCGNANLITLIPTLMLKREYAERFEVGVSEEALSKLTQFSRSFDELLNRAPDRHAPYVGAAAFATKAGIHASAILKDPKTYEHVTPGKRRQPPPRAGLRSGRQVEPRQPAEGAAYRGRSLRPAARRVAARGEGARGAGLCLRGGGPPRSRCSPCAIWARCRKFFDVKSFRVMVERRYNAVGELVTMSEAVVKLVIDGEEHMSVAEGNGPVNALDIALRKDLGKYQSEDREPRADGLQGAYPQRRHGGHHPRADREHGREDRRALVHGRRVA